jgi:hypothetical protein
MLSSANCISIDESDQLLSNSDSHKIVLSVDFVTLFTSSKMKKTSCAHYLVAATWRREEEVVEQQPSPTPLVVVDELELLVNTLARRYRRGPRR